MAIIALHRILTAFLDMDIEILLQIIMKINHIKYKNVPILESILIPSFLHKLLILHESPSAHIGGRTNQDGENFNFPHGILNTSRQSVRNTADRQKEMPIHLFLLTLSAYANN